VLSRIRVTDWVLLRRVAKKLPPLPARIVGDVGSAAGFGKLWVGTTAALATTGPRGRRAGLEGMGAYLVATTLANGPIKWSTRRKRPGGLATLDLPGSGKSRATSSFPSAHAAGAVAYAVAAGSRQPVAAPVLGAAAVAIGVSRIYGAQHFPTDVLGGSALGAAVGVGIAWAARQAAGSRHSEQPDAEDEPSPQPAERSPAPAAAPASA